MFVPIDRSQRPASSDCGNVQRERRSQIGRSRRLKRQKNMTNFATGLRVFGSAIIVLVLCSGLAKASTDGDLIAAAAAADVAKVRSLLDAGADPNFVDPEGMTPLLASFESIDRPDAIEEVLQLLISHGADLDANYPPLVLLTGSAMFILDYSDTIDGEDEAIFGRFITFLIENGADPHAMVNQPDEMMCAESAWTIAVRWTEITRLLLTAGADINSESAEGDTPLILAVTASDPWNEEIIEYLVGNGALIDHKNKRGETALSYALCGPYQLGYLFLRDPIYFSDTHSTRLMKLGADINLANGKGATPLMQAVNCLAPSNVFAVLGAGAEIGALDDVHQTALHYVAEGILTRDTLLNEYSDTDELPEIGLDAIRDVVSLLLQAGVAPDHQDAQGMTALAAAESIARDSRLTPQGTSDINSLIEVLRANKAR